MKLLSTQLTSLIQQLSKQEETMTEIARLLVQSAVGDGTVFLAAVGEMKAVTFAAIEGPEALPFAREWKPESYVTSADRVFILAKKDEGDELAGRLSDAGIPFAMLCTEKKESDLPEVLLSLGIGHSNAISDGAEKNVVPHALAALYVYQSVKLLMDEMLNEASY